MPFKKLIRAFRQNFMHTIKKANRTFVFVVTITNLSKCRKRDEWSSFTRISDPIIAGNIIESNTLQLSLI